MMDFVFGMCATPRFSVGPSGHPYETFLGAPLCAAYRVLVLLHSRRDILFNLNYRVVQYHIEMSTGVT